MPPLNGVKESAFSAVPVEKGHHAKVQIVKSMCKEFFWCSFPATDVATSGIQADQ